MFAAGLLGSPGVPSFGLDGSEAPEKLNSHRKGQAGNSRTSDSSQSDASGASQAALGTRSQLPPSRLPKVQTKAAQPTFLTRRLPGAHPIVMFIRLMAFQRARATSESAHLSPGSVRICTVTGRSVHGLALFVV